MTTSDRPAGQDDEAARVKVPGCCVDRRYNAARGCTTETCMTLPQGETCGSCRHAHRCASIFGMRPEDTKCSFFPRRFAPGGRTTEGK